MVAHSSRQYVPAAIRLKAVGGAERKIEGLFWAACVCWVVVRVESLREVATFGVVT